MPPRRPTRKGDPALVSSARVKLRNQVKKLGLPCAKCGRPIDYQAKALTPWAYVLGEIVPRYLGGSPVDPNNVQPEHHRCNAQEGARITNRIRRVKRSRPMTANRW